MKQSLQLRLGQHLAMTPQLQQAIKLLQLSSLELQQEIQEVLDSNMMLETNEEEAEGSEEKNEVAEEPAVELEAQAIGENSEIPDELPVDSNWDDIYDMQSSASAAPSDDDRDTVFQGTTTENLTDHLTWQLEMSHFSDEDRLIAEEIIDAIDEDGYLSAPLSDIHESLLDSLPELELDEIEMVLHQVQNFDPVGVAARDLKECLLLQLRLLTEDGELKDLAVELLNNHFELLAKRDYNQIIRRMKVDEESLKAIIEFIQSLNPRPGGQVAVDTTEYIVPDVYVRKVQGKWQVDLNPETSPKLRVNPYYASLVQRGNSSKDNQSMKNHLQEARWFLKSLQSRNETLLKVANAIVERQSGFFDHGEEMMKPLVLHDIADAVDMHESTISRVTTKKYLHCPRGIYELKYFFSSHVTSNEGDDVSSTAIHAQIKKLIAEENPKKPLSDNKITSLLADQGIDVARRTVAKYREALNIPPSNQRKRLA